MQNMVAQLTWTSYPKTIRVHPFRNRCRLRPLCQICKVSSSSKPLKSSSSTSSSLPCNSSSSSKKTCWGRCRWILKDKRKDWLQVNKQTIQRLLRTCNIRVRLSIMACRLKKRQTIGVCTKRMLMLLLNSQLQLLKLRLPRNQATQISKIWYLVSWVVSTTTWHRSSRRWRTTAIPKKMRPQHSSKKQQIHTEQTRLPSSANSHSSSSSITPQKSLSHQTTTTDK